MRRAQDIGGRALQETRQKEREKKRFRHRRNKRFVELKGVSAEMLTLYIGGGRQWGSGSCPSSSLPDKEGLLGGRDNAWASGHSPQPPPKNTNTPAAPQVTDRRLSGGIAKADQLDVQARTKQPWRGRTHQVPI
ncbi:uncharacterized protein LOC119590016 isoform X1 [Penaeus monodon]|uniref:uncharacterized protein LOC119590016 isoform X1 n=1 Tax=Penaeus monodon TaxID=6687 RepID=UPI0018A79EBC|nr:uncharacterized protein LOC119590016 isoform X1 [Penaeus monodon]